ncbi:MAG TPA: diaminopimelate epimerase [Thermoanaerobaculia bacterium]|nr:diaminopimelate epimerase [Thermoanaerobaculia bacterium]
MTRFFKLSGSGNDFLALAQTAETSEEPSPERIRAWCRRGVSLGADGLFVLRRAPEGVAMDYWNADGRPADLCLNGTRCAAQLAFQLGWGEGTVKVATPAGGFSARRLDGSRIALDLPAPAEPPRPLELEVEGRTLAGWAVTVGVPHFVLVWPESLERAPVVPLGRLLRFHPALGAAGANVDFVRFPRPGRMEIRTYERGVEDETLSCGTGVLAGAAAGLALGLAALPLAVLTQGGFELEVGGEAGSWSLAGDARVVAEGELLAAAEEGPPPPAWS